MTIVSFKLFLTAVLLNLVSVYNLTQAAPTVTAVSGDFEHDSSITISGSGFGTKATAAPLIWAPFDDGLQPSPLGQRTQWDGVDHMVWSPDDGGTAKSTLAETPWGVTARWTLRVDHDHWTADGQQMYFYRKEKKNFLITDSSQNWKSWRMWSEGSQRPNIYASESHNLLNVEYVSTEEHPIRSGYYAPVAVTTTEWVQQEFVFKASSIDQKDGYLRIDYDGKTSAEGTVLTRTTDNPHLMVNNYVVHGVAANPGQWDPPFDVNNTMWADDVYLDDTWARVMLGDASTWANSTHREIQIPSAWDDNSITVSVNPATWDGPAYLYVIDQDGQVNETGYSIAQVPEQSTILFAGLAVMVSLVVRRK